MAIFLAGANPGWVKMIYNLVQFLGPILFIISNTYL
jgi:hypothetical protein